MKKAPANQKIHEGDAQRHSISKEITMLNILARRSLNTFEAKDYGDSCLHSTVSTLRSKGHIIRGDWELIKNRFGGKTRVMRYRLTRAVIRLEPAIRADA